MAVVYRLPGVLADVALVVYVLVLLALLAAAHAVLTLPGIAGFVLSIGMAVDANVLIFERIKEELWSGKTLRSAVQIGFQRAFSSVFDSHVTTIVGAGVLFLLGTGTVKGFAYTLFWGTVFSLFTAVFITRFFVDVSWKQLCVDRPEERTGRSDVFSPPELEHRRLVQHRLVDLVCGHRARHRLDDLPLRATGSPLLRLGLSFTGGTDITAKYTQARRAEQVKAALATVGITDATVNTIGEPGRTTASATRSRRRRRSATTRRRSGTRWRRRARSIARVVAVSHRSARRSRANICSTPQGAGHRDRHPVPLHRVPFRLELHLRLVTVVALVRDAAMMIGIYAIADRRVDDAFLAAVLTVIGYSVMDTIVILDRIRENTKLMAGQPYEKIVNSRSSRR